MFGQSRPARRVSPGGASPRSAKCLRRGSEGYDVAFKPPVPEVTPAMAGKSELVSGAAEAAQSEVESRAAGPDTDRTTADLQDGLVRMKGLVDQLRRRLDRRREPRDTEI